MISINYYLDKQDKKGYSPIHLRIICNGKSIKISISEKVKENDFDKSTQRLFTSAKHSEMVNNYLQYLEKRCKEIVEQDGRKIIDLKDLKSKLQQIINGYKAEKKYQLIKEKQNMGNKITFVDLFAGAGGFSEGLLQATHKDKYFDFLLASDINENCELTHIARYNHQLGLSADFITQDITEASFKENLSQKLKNKKVDVVCGGPPCQSYSLAGKRSKFDKKDDLFSNYLEVIKLLQPKYFIMENVKGILTKEKGQIKNMIIDEINSIIDVKEISTLIQFLHGIRKNVNNKFYLDLLEKRIQFETNSTDDLQKSKDEFIKLLENKFKKSTSQIIDYKTSKTDPKVNTIRHGLNLLKHSKKFDSIRKDLIKEKDACYIDNDAFVNSFNDFIHTISEENIIEQINAAIEELNSKAINNKDFGEFIQGINIYSSTLHSCFLMIEDLIEENQKEEVNSILNDLKLYRIDKPFVANASNYGVPQNRERVLFIGCRKDQKLIKDIPATVSENEKVTVLEALWDLDFVGNNEEARNYKNIGNKKLNGSIKKRSVAGELSDKGLSYVEWSRKGRLSEILNCNPPVYFKSKEDFKKKIFESDELLNHKTSNQREEVVKRLKIILEQGSYSLANQSLQALNLASEKRNYNVLNKDKQSPTIVTMPDDFIHYANPRSLTVREMARLQSFDDSFVFQGKRSTGGNMRKNDVPQYTLVGNAVPPLLARAVGVEILKHIK